MEKNLRRDPAAGPRLAEAVATNPGDRKPEDGKTGGKGPKKNLT